jgi:hypothetical protein
MDILGGMSNTEEKPQIYFGFKTIGQQFFVNGETPIDFKYLQLDIDTFKSGWGRYTKSDGFEYQWDAKFGVVDPKPADDWKRAFSCWVMPDGGHAMLWQRFTFAESSAFNKILGTFWNQKDANVGKLPVMEYKGSKPIQVGMGSSSELTFEFVKWGDRGFQVPDWYVDPDAPVDNDDGFVSPNEGLADKVAEMVAKTELSDDDIPF